jgi:hypothetical protein
MKKRNDYEAFRNRFINSMDLRIRTIRRVYDIANLNEWYKAKNTRTHFHKMTLDQYFRVIKEPCKSCLISVKCVRYGPYFMVDPDEENQHINPNDPGIITIDICERLARQIDDLYKRMKK